MLPPPFPDTTQHEQPIVTAGYLGQCCLGERIKALETEQGGGLS